MAAAASKPRSHARRLDRTAAARKRQPKMPPAVASIATRRRKAANERARRARLARGEACYLVKGDGEIVDALQRFAGLGEHEGHDRIAVSRAIQRLIDHAVNALRCRALPRPSGR